MDLETVAPPRTSLARFFAHVYPVPRKQHHPHYPTTLLFYQVGVIDNTDGKLFVMCSDMFFSMGADTLISMGSDMRFPLHGL